jgi:excisionase family DNA binding protein
MLAPMPATQETTPGPMVSLQEAAKWLDCNPRTIRRYIASGRLPAYRMASREIRIDITDLAAMLNKIPTAGQPSDYPKYNLPVGGPHGA